MISLGYFFCKKLPENPAKLEELTKALGVTLIGTDAKGPDGLPAMAIYEVTLVQISG